MAARRAALQSGVMEEGYPCQKAGSVCRRVPFGEEMCYHEVTALCGKALLQGDLEVVNGAVVDRAGILA